MKQLMSASPRRAASRLVAVSAVAALLSAGCAAGANSGADGSAGGDGVPAGASKKDYVAALSEMTPVELTMQSAGSPRDDVSRPLEQYADAVDQWSGGKITFEIIYGSAIAKPNEVADALADGRLGVSQVFPVYEPDRHPTANALVDMLTLVRNTPVAGTLQANSAMLEAAFATPAISEEFKDRGVHLLGPALSDAGIVLFCAAPGTSLADIKGRQTRIGIASQAQQVKGLGMSPVSLAFPEVYEGLQRGIVDCATTSLPIADLVGLIPVAKHIVADPDLGFGRSTSGLGVDDALWSDLPLAAQQLLHDRLDVFIESSVRASWDLAVAALKELERVGGSFSRFAPDAREALRKANEQIRNSAGDKASDDGGAFVQRWTETTDKWWNVVTEDLGYTDEVDLAGFASWYAKNKIDLTPYIERLRSDVLDKYRPGN